MYILGLMVTGFLLFGVGGYLVYQQIQKVSAAIQVFIKLPVMCEGMSLFALGELNHRQDVIFKQNHGLLGVILEQKRDLSVVLELIGRMDKNLEKFQARLSEN